MVLGTLDSTNPPFYMCGYWWLRGYPPDANERKHKYMQNPRICTAKLMNKILIHTKAIRLKT